MMNKLAVAGVIGALAPVAGLAGPAVAADLAMDPQQSCDNSRTYIGGQLGFAGMNSDWSVDDWWFNQQDASLSDTGFSAGAFIGHDMDLCGFVLGAEADFNFMDLSDSHSWIDGPEGLTVTTSVQTLGSIRARIGVPVDNLLFYATAGIGFGNVSASYDLSTDGRNNSETKNFAVGAVAGGGIEAKLNDQMTVRLQGLYYNFGDVDFTDIDNAGSHYSANANTFLLSAGFAWQF